MEANFDGQNPHERPEIVSPTFIILLGPSGVGKSTIIEGLINEDSRIVKSPVYTDRAPRENDTNRVSVGTEVFNQMSENGEFLTVEPSYGNRYAVHKEFVLNALSRGLIPIQDYPEDVVQKLKEKVPVHTIYIVPPTLSELRKRINIDGRDSSGGRYEESKEKIIALVKQHFKTENIDEVVINRNLDDTVQQVLKSIYKKVAK